MAQIPTYNGNSGPGSSGRVGVGVQNASGNMQIIGHLSNVTTSNASSNYGYYTHTGASGKVIASSSSNEADLPALVIPSSDEFGNKVNLTLNPEPGIMNGDLTKLMMMCWAVNLSPGSFNALSYVKKNNLERHFTYS